MGIAFVTLGILSTMELISFPSLTVFCFGLFYCILISFLWFSIQFLTGILAFWLEQTWILRALIQTIITFLSGFIIPLEFFPDWLVTLLNYTPFPFMTYYPVKIFMGESIPWAEGPFILFIWILVMVVLNTLIWRRGIRLYTAAGM